MKKIIFGLLLICFSFDAFSLEIPKDYKLQNDNDYKKYEPVALNCINWLYSTPINKEKDVRSKAQSFLIQWISGTNLVSITMYEKITSPMLNNPEVLMIYLGGCAKYQLEHKKSGFTPEANFAGTVDAINFYKANKNYLKPSPGLDDYIKRNDAGTLKNYLNQLF